MPTKTFGFNISGAATRRMLSHYYYNYNYYNPYYRRYYNPYYYNNYYYKPKVVPCNNGLFDTYMRT